MSKGFKTKTEVVRVAGKLKEIITVHDEAGNLLQKMMRPLMVEFYFRDLMQVIIGATVLAIPVGFTQEVWDLGYNLPMRNIFALAFISLVFISLFVYYNFYRDHLREHWFEFIKRILTIYLTSFLVVALMLTLIQVAPWQTDHVLAIKRVILVTFPASLSAAIADMIK